MAGSDNANEPESFLRRWSLRKRAMAVQAEDRAPTPSSKADPAVDATHTALAGVPPAGVTAEDKAMGVAAPAPVLPDPEILDAASDYSVFMSPYADAGLRQRALRKLFALPQFAIRDGLDDYDADYTQFEGLGDIVTHEVRRLAQREARRFVEQAGECDRGAVCDKGDAEAESRTPHCMAQSEEGTEEPGSSGDDRENLHA